MSNRQPSDRFGEVRQGEEDRTLVVFRRPLDHTAAKVWAAITAPAQRAVWAPGVRFEPAADARFDIWFGDECEGPSHVSGRVDPYVPQTSLGLGSMCFELSPAGRGSVLVFSDILWFDDKRTKVEFANAVLAGWHRFLDTLEMWLDEGVSALALKEPNYAKIDVPGRDALNSLPAFESGRGRTVQIGYVNPNGQKCHGHRRRSGNLPGQKAYKLECLNCGCFYGANGCDVHLRKCPDCGGGADGIWYQ